jgi:large repetitive protein
MRYEDASHTGEFQGQGPIANDDLELVAAGQKSSATGNLITGEGTQSGAAGADSAAGAHITSIAGKGGEDSSFAGGKLSVMGDYGKLSVDADGNYIYQVNKGVENVRDRFTYTLADGEGASDSAALIVEIGKTPLVIQANAQQIVPGPDGVVTLPPGVELSDVHVVGRNLVIDMPDGTQLIIVDGAVRAAAGARRCRGSGDQRRSASGWPGNPAGRGRNAALEWWQLRRSAAAAGSGCAAWRPDPADGI